MILEQGIKENVSIRDTPVVEFRLYFQNLERSGGLHACIDRRIYEGSPYAKYKQISRTTSNTETYKEWVYLYEQATNSNNIFLRRMTFQLWRVPL